MKDEIIERIAISLFDQDTDNFVLPWESQPGRIRTQTRRHVRKVMNAIHICSSNKDILKIIEDAMT